MEFDFKRYVKFFVLFGVIVVIIILFLIFDGDNDSTNKLFVNYDYVYELDSDYKSDFVSGIPQINVNVKDINKINRDLTKGYYDVVVEYSSSYSYEYVVYGDILILMVVSNVYDDSEYGMISYDGYYIDIVNGVVLDDEEFLNRINVGGSLIEMSINNRYREFYNKDSFGKGMSFDEYVVYVNSSSDGVYFIRDNKLYLYKLINYTHDIIHNDFGNIYEFYICDLS